MAAEDLRDTIRAGRRERIERASEPARGTAEAFAPTLRRLFITAESADRFPPELAFLVAEGIAPKLLVDAAQRAADLGVTGEAVLFGTGLSDDHYYRLLARHLGASYLEAPLPLAAGIDVSKAADLGAALLAPNRQGLHSVHGPRGRALRRLIQEADRQGGPVALTTPRRLDAMLRRHDGAGPRSRAANGLADWDASLSARGGPAPWQARLAVLLTMAIGFAAGARPEETFVAVSLLLFPLFAAAVAQRLFVVWASPPPGSSEPDASADRDLPVYTLLVPLFREARVLPRLVQALDALDYPVLCRKRNICHL